MSDQQRKGMGAAGVITILVVTVYLGLELYGLHHARERMAPGAVFEEFAGIRHAARVCGIPAAGSEDFERNFRAVTARARRALDEPRATATPGPDGGEGTPEGIPEEEPPSDSRSTIDQTLAELRLARESEVDALIAAEGCSGKAVWRLLKLYEARSRLRLRG